MNKPVRQYLLPLLGIIILCAATSNAENQICLYKNEKNVTQQVNSPNSVPLRFRANSKCFSSHSNDSYLASPENVTLEGNVGEKTISTSLGKMELRWSRKVQALFRRSPEKALSDAANAAAKALRSNGFPPQLAEKARDLPWKVVFMDDTAPATEIPQQLISNCHPAWMTPPANLYIVSQRVAAGCEQKGARKAPGVSDSDLAHILIHEIGHVVEHLMIGQLQGAEKMRAEGFASWFEQYASDFSSSVKDGSVKEYYSRLARQSFIQSPSGFNFQGSAYDYARASSYFHAVTRRGGIRNIVRIYEVIGKKNLSLFQAINEVMRWDHERIETEARKAL